MKKLEKSEKGFTLIETVIAVALTGLISAAATGVIVQVMQGSRSTQHMIALRQVQTAGYWVSNDGIQAQQVVTSSGSGLPFTLTWNDDNASHEIEYSLQDMSSGDLDYLQRREILNGDVNHPIMTVVGQYIDPAYTSTSCTPVGRQLSAGETFTFTVTAKINQQTETRIYEVQPRALPKTA
jgi:prepilin-type N-terminal cleavage/methylation domain-containing protein